MPRALAVRFAFLEPAKAGLSVSAAVWTRSTVRANLPAAAQVSAPIGWDELDDPGLRPDRWTIRTIVERVEAVGDLFADAQTDLQELPPLG